MKTICIIPARFASTRLPGKPLADICGKPLIARVYERAIKAKLPALVIVAVDDERVKEAVEKAGGRAVMTKKEHNTGSDRIAEVAGLYPDADVIINIQGDEPLIEPALIDELARQFESDPNLQMATVKAPMGRKEALEPGNVKVVTDKDGYALYFSRSLLPYPRNENCAKVYKHIGIYAYRRDFLLSYTKLPATPLEQAESLEQLRALENGYKIKVIDTDKQFIGVDTPEDLERVRKYFAKQGKKGFKDE